MPTLFQAVLLLFISTSVFASGSEGAPTLYVHKTLSVESASKAAWGAIVDCRKRGYSVAVAVVDLGGNLQVFYRDRFAGPHTPDTAFKKAWTANSFRQDTSTLADFLQRKVIPDQVQHNPGALLVGGGVLITAAGTIVGAIGVSGAPPGKTEKDSIDGACGQAGIALIQEDLDFSE